MQTGELQQIIDESYIDERLYKIGGEILYSIILVEDEFTQREILKKMILSVCNFIKIYEADSESTALDIVKNNDINMFLIDINLKGSSGLNLAMNIRSIPKYEFSQLIFLTTHMDYMLQAFKQTHCYDYILKPYNKDDIQSMLNKLIDRAICNLNKVEEKEFIIKIRKSIFVRVKVNDVLFIEVKGRDCEVNTVRGIYTYINISLKKILDLIDCDYIVQSHRAFAINKNHIFKIEKVDIRLSCVYFENYPQTALIGIKFRNNIIPEFKKAGKYYDN
ncbi:DNA-binding LytR/AlgR family response regulator [Clostridium beijerinckii]|jgi:Response regulator of the LytR/AlgR family|uniref:Stage 0 sporulation protein A homolog n=1 Tax=Clostridium beijerinckii (strain ATCC 51743 / NCIMB 8052) TaxID=290402 RepID=A6LQ26_CLOB8|nr:two component transcriptional regulator, LytTR family [Clostridium beijerinckii NCIMB 8052]AIU03713.1 LytTR family two component transcriptional regulator [Clostridium beijerinckii ATCC 35702]NRT26320.1 DNA-binding LytR/AlgR family response regulator [Clostridium beijerinckii]NRT66073.1 DNA-binding LytR/AlgR family response regulator [Clostridium beijerinckii]NRT82417.1 DNA-binding LytR/AlgR family response regulator [Clostridium beijerinckii]